MKQFLQLFNTYRLKQSICNLENSFVKFIKLVTVIQKNLSSDNLWLIILLSFSQHFWNIYTIKIPITLPQIYQTFYNFPNQVSNFKHRNNIIILSIILSKSSFSSIIHRLASNFSKVTRSWRSRIEFLLAIK